MTYNNWEDMINYGQRIIAQYNTSLAEILPALDKDSPKFNQQFSDSIHESIKNFYAQEAKANNP